MTDTGSVTATLGGSGYLAGLANGSLDVYIEGLQANSDFSLTYKYVDTHGETEASASVHMAIADISFVDVNGCTVPQLGTDEDFFGPAPTNGRHFAG